MRLWNELKFIIRKLNRRRATAELEEEIRTHLELETQGKIEEGYSPEAARYAARRLFGNVLISKEKSRVVWGLGLLETLWNDLRYSSKTLRKTPGFTLTAVITLGLGIGASAAIYSVLNAIFFKPLQGVQHPEQLCRIELIGQPDREFEKVPYSNYLEIRQTIQTLSGLAAYRSIREKVGLQGQPFQDLYGEMVSGDYFQVLGVRAVLGRVLTPDDETGGSSNAIVLGYATWRNLLQADPQIIGKEFVGPGGRSYIVVGVASPDFHGSQPPTDSRYWIMIDRGEQLKFEMKQRTIIARNGFSLIGRMKRESSLRQIRAELELYFAHFRQLRPDIYMHRFAGVDAARGFILSSGREDVFRMLMVTGTVVGVLLLIVCANVAGLQLARAMTRNKEIAVRLALGASRWRIICLLLTESVLLALMGGMLAAVINFQTTAIVSQSLDTILLALPRENLKGMILDFSPDWYVFIVTLLISISVGAVCGLVPALKTSKADLTEVTKSEASLQAIRIRRLSWHNLMVVMQVAGSVLLLILAGLILRSFRQTLEVNPGFQSHNLFITEVNSSKRNLPLAQHDQFFRELQEKAATLPNVKSIAAGEGPPQSGGSEVITVDGTGQNPFGGNYWINRFWVYTPKYFETLGIQLVAGRDFTDRDFSGAQSTVIIDERIARQAFPGQNPIGRYLRLDAKRNWDIISPVEIIGVVKDVNYVISMKGRRPNFYLPGKHYYSESTIFVRTHHDPAATLPAIAQLIRRLDPEAPFRLRTMDEALYLNMLPLKIVSAFFAFFGAVGLILAAVGLLGVMGYSVARRTKEIGIRMALGADRNQVLRMIIGEGLALTLTGMVIGMSATAGLIRLITTVRNLDLLSYGGAILVLLTAALLACYLPARKAANVDPMTALRQE